MKRVTGRGIGSIEILDASRIEGTIFCSFAATERA
jgi:hypothetical protein